MVDVDLGGLLQDSSVGVYCWGYLLLGKLGVGSSILENRPSFGKSPRNLGNSWATNDGEVQ